MLLFLYFLHYYIFLICHIFPSILKLLNPHESPHYFAQITKCSCLFSPCCKKMNTSHTLTHYPSLSSHPPLSLQHYTTSNYQHIHVSFFLQFWVPMSLKCVSYTIAFTTRHEINEFIPDTKPISNYRVSYFRYQPSDSSTLGKFQISKFRHTKCTYLEHVCSAN